MSDKWLLLDCPYMARRAMYSTGGLQYNDVLTGVVYGFLKSITVLQDRFATRRVVFAFDHIVSYRKAQYKQYKAHRKTKELTPEQEDYQQEYYRQVNLLRKEYLKELGFRNVFYKEGYEADDIIAQIVKNSLKSNDSAVIVSTDKDLFQCLKPGKVILYNPAKQEVTTYESMTQKYGITPLQWADVKAIGGCPSDNVKGVRGVGEKTAIKFLTGNLHKGPIFHRIIEGNDIWKRNLSLVKLPLAGCPKFKLRKDKVTAMAWQSLADRLGMKSLRNDPPVTVI